MIEKILWVICGATASGKSDLALALAEKYDGEIVNADSRQIYKGLEIGTAAPNNIERARVPHHLYSFLSPDKIYSAADYSNDARKMIRAIFKRGKQPIVVGGTGLYIKALIDGLSALPQKNSELRAQLQQRLQQEGSLVLHEELRKIDPESAQRIPHQNTQRLIRALEVCHLGKKPLSVLQKENAPVPIEFEVKLFGLFWDRKILRQRIEKRSAQIFPAIVEETKKLLAQKYDEKIPALQSLGYAQALQFLHGKISKETAIALLSTKTMQYAKRQQTWFKADARVQWVEGSSPQQEIKLI